MDPQEMEVLVSLGGKLDPGTLNRIDSPDSRHLLRLHYRAPMQEKRDESTMAVSLKSRRAAYDGCPIVL